MKKYLQEIFRVGIVAGLAVCAPVFTAFARDNVPSSSRLNPKFTKWRESKNNAASSGLIQTRSSSGMSFGLIPAPFDTSYLANLVSSNASGAVRNRSNYASKYDLRDYRYLTSVKNQNPYGTCWAHAACAAMESSLLKIGAGTWDFSENNMVNLSGFDWGFDDGGNASMASAYVLRWAGPVLESEDAYPDPGSSVARSPARHVQNVRWIPARTSFSGNDGIKQAILDYGGIHTSYYHDGSYLSADGKSYCCGYTRDTNHAVLIVGWDDTYDADNFVGSPAGDGAFIVRNSWGDSWGESGYFYVSYYDANFAFGTMYAFLAAEGRDNYDSVYQYDPLGELSSFGWAGSTTGWGANMFVAKSAESVAAVGFYALVPGTQYTLYIYTGCNASSPRSGSLAHSQSGTTDMAGFFTVPLTSVVGLDAGERFSVVLSLTTPGYSYPLAYETRIAGYASAASANSGESFYSRSGSSWTDLTEYDFTANFCCKAYTQAAAQAAIVNDDFSDAALLTGMRGSVKASNVGATFEAGEPVHVRSSATTSIWWKWIPERSGVATFHTGGSSIDTVMAIYTGTTISSLEGLTSDDDSGEGTASLCTFEVKAGNLYYIAVAGYSGATGDISLTWDTEVYYPDLKFDAGTWPQSVFLSKSNASSPEEDDVYEYGEDVYLYCRFKNGGEGAIVDDFSIMHEVYNAHGDLIDSWIYSHAEPMDIEDVLQWGGTWFSGLNGLPPSSYTYRCTLDVYDEVEELNETDNVFEYDFIVTERNYTVIFNPGGGSISGSSTISVVSGSAIGSLPRAFRSGYALVGWFTSSVGGTRVTAETVVSSDMTLYARWVDADTALNGIRYGIEGYGCGMSVYGSAPWLYDDVADYMRSGGVADGQESVFEMTVYGPGSVSFEWMVSSENNYDELVFIVDGVEKASISGVTDWDSESYWISGYGNHVICWKYRKDSSVSRGEDCGLLRDIGWSGAKITPTVTFDANGGTVERSTVQCEVGRWYDSYYPDVWREGYALKGWFSARNGGLNAADYRVQMYALTLYAQWQSVYPGSCPTAAKRIYMDSGVSVKQNALLPWWDSEEQIYDYEWAEFYYRIKLQRGRKYTFAVPSVESFVDGWMASNYDYYDYGDYDINWYEDGSLEYMVIDTTTMTVAERDFVIYVGGDYIGQNTTLYYAPGDLVPVGISGKPEALPGDCNGEETSISGSRSLNGGDYYFSTVAEPGVRYELSVSGVNGIGMSATGNWRALPNQCTPGPFVLEPDSYVETSNAATFVFSVEERTAVRLRVNAPNASAGTFTAVWRRSSPVRAIVSALGGDLEFSEDEFYNDEDAPWFADYSQMIDGRPTLRSGVIGNSMTTEFTAVISADKLVPPIADLKPGLRFKCRTSSEAGCDYLKYALDGVWASESIGGETQWRTVLCDCSHWMDGYDHEVTFRYRKDSSVDRGSDCVWISGLDIVWVADPEVFMPALTEDENTFGLDESSENLWLPDYKDGRMCVRSPEMDEIGSESCAVRFEGAGRLAFDYKISCSRTGAKLTVSIDGREVAASGEVGWATYECIVGPGSHEIRWTYAKTAAESEGEDCAWISELRLVPVNCTLYFNANGGNCSQTSKRVVYGEEIGTLPIPRRSGFMFDGWYTASVGGGQVASNTIMSVAGDYTLYAHWKDFGTMANELRDILYLEGCEILLAGDAPWKEGSLDSGSCGLGFIQSGDISDSQESILQITVDGPGRIDFEWCVSSEEDWDFLEFIVDGVAVSAISGEMNVLDDWEELSHYISGEGRHVIQWRYSKDSSVSEGADCGYFRNINWSGRKIAPLVRFNANGGQAEYSSAYCALGDRYEYYYPDAWREGYGLLGWFSSPQGGVDAKDYRVLKDSLTLYAHWQKVTVGSCYSAAKRLYMGSGVKSINTTLTPDWWYDDEQGGFVYDWDYGVYNYRIKLQRDRVYTFAAPCGDYWFGVWDWNERLDVTWYSDDNLEYAVVDTHGIDTQEIEVIIDFWDGFVGESATLYYAPGDLVPVGIRGRPEALPGDCNGEETSISGGRSLNGGDYYFSTVAEPGVRYELSVSGVNGIGISATVELPVPGSYAPQPVSFEPDSYVETSNAATFVFSVEERTEVRLRVNALYASSGTFAAVWRRSSPMRAMLSALGGNLEFSEDELYNDENYSWFADYSQMLDGKPTLRSGAIGDSAATAFTAVISADELVPPAADLMPKLRFKWKVSSESGFDYLRYALDGVSASGGISGTTQWQSVAVDISSWMDGYDHEISFTYSKDVYVSNGQDCGWIGDLEIVWTSDPEVFMPSLTSDDVFELYESSDNSWFPAVKDSRTCVRSPQINGAGESSFTVNFTGAGKLLFDYRISCSQTGAKLTVSIDGHEVSASGEIPWATYAADLDYGEHIVTWTYEKTNASGSGADAAFISNLRFEPIVPPGSHQDLAVEIYPDNTVRAKNFLPVPEVCPGCSEGDSGVYYMKATLKKGEVYTFAVPKEISAFGYISGEAWRWFCCSDDGRCVAGECTTDYYEDAVYDYCVVDLRAGKYDSSIPNEFVYYIPVYGEIGYPTFMYYVKGDYAPRPEPR